MTVDLDIVHYDTATNTAIARNGGVWRLTMLWTPEGRYEAEWREIAVAKVIRSATPTVQTYQSAV